LKKRGITFDIVGSSSCHSSCFTKNYGRFTEGTGSVLKLLDEDIWTVADSTGLTGRESVEEVANLRLRFFTPLEISKLHGFPDSFTMTDLTPIQSYRLLGNSLHVIVVSILVAYLMK